MSGHRIIQTIQSPYPAHNAFRRNEAVASDTIFSEVAAICTNGPWHRFLLVALRLSLISSECLKQFVNTLEDVIRSRGAMDKLITERSRRDLQTDCRYLRSLCIDAWQSEPLPTPEFRRTPMESLQETSTGS
jgi:hypothetical protein